MLPSFAWYTALAFLKNELQLVEVNRWDLYPMYAQYAIMHKTTCIDFIVYYVVDDEYETE